MIIFSDIHGLSSKTEAISQTIIWYICVYFHMTGVTSGAGTAYPPGTPDFTSCFSGVHVARSLVFCVMFCRSLVVFLYLFLWLLVSSNPSFMVCHFHN